MQRRYQDFRQYAATAHDQGDTASLKRLARRFSKDSKRALDKQDAAEAATEAVPGADDDFASLVESCRRCAATQIHCCCRPCRRQLLHAPLTHKSAIHHVCCRCTLYEVHSIKVRMLCMARTSMLA
jgi:hypothetical protein